MASSFHLRQKHNLQITWKSAETVRAVVNYLGNRHRFKVLVGYKYSHALNLSRPQTPPLTRRNGLVNQVEFLGLTGTLATV